MVTSRSDLGSQSHEGSSKESFGVSHLDGAFKGLDFSLGIQFDASIRKRFMTTMHPTFESGHFIMVVSFGRVSFKLDNDLVGLALEAAIGGSGHSLKVSLLRDRTFSFNVSSKQVGFLIYELKSYTCKLFKCFFKLWGNGGPNWMKEFSS